MFEEYSTDTLSYQTIFDIVNRLFSFAANRPYQSPALHLARAVGQAFPNCSVRVLWIPPSWESDPKSAWGAQWWFEVPEQEVERRNLSDRMDWPIPMEEDEIRADLGRASSLTLREVSKTLRLKVSQRQERPSILVICPTSENSGLQGDLWLLLEGGKPLDEDRFDRLSRYVSGLSFLYFAFSALQRTGEVAALSSEIHAFSFDIERTTEFRVKRGAELLEKASQFLPGAPSTFAPFVKNLAESMLQELFGSGWDLRTTAGQRIDDLDRFFDQLERAIRYPGSEKLENVRGIENSKTFEDLKALEELKALEAVLRAVMGKGQKPRPESFSSDQRALYVVATWSRLFQQIRQFEDISTIRESIEREWENVAKETVVDLSLLLKRWSVSKEDKERLQQDRLNIGIMSVPYIPPWLRLWFCLDLLRNEVQNPSFQKRNISEAEKWRFRADLAYVVREGVRVFLYARRADYRFQPEALARALRTLVEHHAIWIVRLPRQHDIRGLLEIIGQAHSMEVQDFGAGHLRHVFEVYIAGQLLCSLRVRPPAPDAPTNGGELKLQSVLAGRVKNNAGDLTSGDFLKAFSLAALLHDVGRLLFPRWSTQTDNLVRIDRLLRNEWKRVQQSLARDARNILEQCKKELMEAGYLNSRSEPQAVQWIEEKSEKGEADLAVLGAWYLHRICRGVEDLPDDTLRQAVRAILFHRMVTQPIDVETDPVAALLVLCDELFAWEPQLGSPVVGGLGRSFQALAADHHLRPSRFESLQLVGLNLEIVQENNLDLLVGFVPGLLSDDIYGVPHFEVDLTDPNGLEGPVHTIWLSLAQNLGRIRTPLRRDRPCWNPLVVLRSKVPEDLKVRDLTTRSLLEEVAHQAPLAIRPSLERWLGETENFRYEDVDGSRSEKVEIVKIKACGKSFHPEDLTPFLPELDRLAELVVLRRIPTIRTTSLGEAAALGGSTGQRES